ncbi:MAG: hypothetical protein CME07_00445, partial [Gemmatimonadetes bacterium]|nr:hypothetical protein [Gemmatimonadota bacterium]
MASSVSSAAKVLSSGDAHLAAGEYSQASERFRLELEGTGREDREQRARISWKLAKSLLETSDLENACTVLDSTLEEIDGVSVLTSARVRALSGWVRFFLGEYEECLRWCESARVALAPTAEHAELARVLRWMSFAERRMGHLEQADELLRESLITARRSGSILEEASTLSALGGAEKISGHLESAAERIERSITLLKESGSELAASRDLIGLSVVQLYLGWLGRARQTIERALGKYRALNGESYVASSLVVLSRICARTGALDEAIAHATEALAASEKGPFRRENTLAHQELGDLARTSGDLEKAEEHYQIAMGIATDLHPEGGLISDLARRIALMQMERGNLAQAEASVRRALDIAEKQCDRREFGNAQRTLAQILSRSGRTAEATDHLNEAVTLFKRIGTPYELGRTHLAAVGVLPSGRGKEADAQILGHLFEARRLFSELGAERDLDEVGRRLKEFEPSDRMETGRPPRTRKRTGDEPGLVTGAPAVREVAALAKALADEDYTVLIEGETGTGKELLARILHTAGGRTELPFVAINCAAIPEHLLESELFGHKKGSFTGASADHPGILPAAETGTVLLDEIDKAGLDFQSKLLRVIEERRVRPVGSIEPVPIKARILCAANNDTRVLAEEGRFLPDLYYRL